MAQMGEPEGYIRSEREIELSPRPKQPEKAPMLEPASAKSIVRQLKVGTRRHLDN
jgi:hypothetical protein